MGPVPVAGPSTWGFTGPVFTIIPWEVFRAKPRVDFTATCLFTNAGERKGGREKERKKERERKRKREKERDQKRRRTMM